MLTIRKTQMQVLSAFMKRAFEDRLFRHITYAFPQQTKILCGDSPDEEKLRSLIRQGIEQAADHGLEDRLDVAAFLSLFIGVGPNFTQQERLLWVSKVLQSKTVPIRAKMRLVFHQLPKRNPELSNLRFPKENGW